MGRVFGFHYGSAQRISRRATHIASSNRGGNLTWGWALSQYTHLIEGGRRKEGKNTGLVCALKIEEAQKLEATAEAKALKEYGFGNQLIEKTQIIWVF